MSDFLSDFIIKETLGKGTFSIVKLGINKKTKEKVAIKILKKKKIIQREDIDRIEREINILKNLNHINVIKIYKINEDSENYYIVMEYCENGELFHYIVERKRLEEDEASFFFYQLVNGLEYIHSKNIVHRDLKPENLLLGKDNILKIIDFGLSNYCEQDDFLETPCGSPCYASPEMISGNKYNGQLIDIWSIGIILFAMVCGYLPFEDPDTDILFKKILKCKIRFPKYLSDITLDLMKKILVAEPNKRIDLENIKRHPFYLKGKINFTKKNINLVEEVEKVSSNYIEKIKLLKNIDNDDYLNNLIKSRELKNKSSENLLNNTTTKNLNDDEEEISKSKRLKHKIEKIQANKVKNKNNKNLSKTPRNLLVKNNILNEGGIKDVSLNFSIINKNNNNLFNKDEKNAENLKKNIDLNNQMNNNDNNNIINNSFNFYKLLNGIDNHKDKIKNISPSSAENKNLHKNEFENIFTHNDSKKNFTLLLKLLSNNGEGKKNNKIILSKNNKNINSYNDNNILIEINKDNNKIQSRLKSYLNFITEYNIKRKHFQIQEENNISQNYRRNTISFKIIKRESFELSPKNLRINKFNNNKKVTKVEVENNSCSQIKKSVYNNIKKIVKINNKYNNIKNDNNLNKNYLFNSENSNIAYKINNNFLSSNIKNITNNISIIKSPKTTFKKDNIIFSKLYNMKLESGKLKQKDNNQDFSFSFNNINNKNIEELRQMQSNSTTNNININFCTSMSNNLNNTTNKIILSNEVSPHFSNNNTNRNNNLFNIRKLLLLSTLNKNINSPEKSKICKYVNVSSGDFLKINKNVESKRKNKNNKLNFKNNFSNLSSNISRIINHRQQKSIEQFKGNSSLKVKKMPLMELNSRKIKNSKKSNLNNSILTLKKIKKERKYSSVDKEIVKKYNSKNLFLNRLNFKKIDSSFFIKEKEHNSSSIIKIRKGKQYNNNSCLNNIIIKVINSGNKNMINHINDYKLSHKNNIINYNNGLMNDNNNEYSNFLKKRNKK